MTEVQRATHPRGTAASPPRVLTRKASAGDDRHPRDPSSPGVRRSRRDLADSAEDLASGAAGSPVKRTREGAPPDNTGPTPASVRAGSCATEEEGGPSSASDEAPWVARWLAGRETPGDDAPNAHAGDVDGDAHRPSPLRRADADSGSTPTLTREPAGGDFTTNWFTHNAESLTAVFTRLGWMNDGTRARRVIEIGCWEGRSTQWLLCSLCRHADSVLYCVDTWRGGEQYADVGFDLGGEAHAGPAVEARFDANVRLVTGVDPNVQDDDGVDVGVDDEHTKAQTKTQTKTQTKAHTKTRRRRNPVRKVKARSLDVLASLLADGRSAGTFDVAYVDGSHAARDVIGDGVMCWELLRRGGVVVFDDYRWDAVMGDAVPAKRCPRMAVDAFLGMFEDELVVLERGYQVVVQKIATRR